MDYAHMIAAGYRDPPLMDVQKRPWILSAGGTKVDVRDEAMALLATDLAVLGTTNIGNGVCGFIFVGGIVI